jgi:hypothetical protein
MSPSLAQYVNPFLVRVRKILKAHAEQKRRSPRAGQVLSAAHMPRALLDAAPRTRA